MTIYTAKPQVAYEQLRLIPPDLVRLDVRIWVQRAAEGLSYSLRTTEGLHDTLCGLWTGWASADTQGTSEFAHEVLSTLRELMALVEPFPDLHQEPSEVATSLPVRKRRHPPVDPSILHAVSIARAGEHDATAEAAGAELPPGTEPESP